ncbi:MAG TPA: 4-hydroxybutyrate CoA-transferase, partial [Puia sp.]
MSKNKYISAEEAVRQVQTGDRVFIHGSAATPVNLVKALQARHNEIHHVELVSITTLGDLDFDNPLY